MKKKLFLKFFVLAVIGAFVTFTSCKDYDDDISKLNTEISALKADMVNKSDLNALKTDLEGKITALQGEVATLKSDLSKYATKAELDAAKADILAKTVTLESYNTFKTWVEDEISKLKADVAKAATKEELETLETLMNSKVAELRTDLAAHIANFDALKLVVDGHSDAIADIQGELADQLALIKANEVEIAAVKADLAAKYAELTAEIDALKDRVTDLESGLAALDTKVEAYKTELDAKIAALSARVDGLEALLLNVYRDLDNRVYSLTFIPDFTSEDGTPQIVVNGVTEWVGATKTSASEYWNVKSPKGKIYKGVTTLRYKVSPSNVKLSDFEVRQLVHKTSAVRAQEGGYSKSDPIVLAGQATLSNGVLSVPVVVEADEYDFNNFYNPGDYKDTPTTRATHAWDYNVSVALQVENVNVAMDNNEKRIITSTEYVKANFDLGTGRIALNDKAMNPWGDGDLLDTSITYANIAGTSYDSQISLWNGKSQSGNMTDVLNHTIDLKQYIYSVFHDYHGIQQAMLDWGFDKHVFKFKRVYLQNEGVNQTNDYVNLTEDGVIGVVPAPGNVVNQAAVGRTPIVEVTAVVNGKVHAVGYIKIHITDAFDNSAVNFEFTLEDYVLGCNSTHKLTDVDIDAIDFDQIFNHPRIQLGKDAFFNEYKQGGLTAAQVVKVTPPTPATATVGITNASDVWFDWAINPQTQSVNLYNYLEGNINNNAPHGTYKVVTTLKSNGYRPDVVITWNFKVVLPTNLALTPNEVFLSNGVYKVEPTVYGQTPTPKTSTPYEGLLQNAYIHSNLDLDFGVLDGTQNCDGYLTPYFIVTKAPAGFHINTVGTQYGTAYQVRENGTNAVAATIQQVAAGDPNPMSKFIVGGFYIKLNNDDYAAGTQIGNFKPLTAAAQRLVDEGLTIDVQPRGYLNGQVLNHVALHDAFTVKFTKPIRFNFAASYQVWDQGVGAKQQVEIYLEKTVRTTTPTTTYYPAVLKDFLGNDLYFGTLSTTAERGLVDHYEIARNSSYVAGINFDFINVNTDLPGGGLPTGMRVKASNASLGTAPNYTKLVIQWENASGGSVQNPFNIYVPVSVNHKWGVEETILTIKVNPGTGI